MTNYMIFFILLFFQIYSQFVETVQNKVVRFAIENDGSKDWSYGDGNFYHKAWCNGVDKWAENGKTFFCDYEPKCNLFVYEMLYKAGLELPLINKMSRKCREYHQDKPDERPPTNTDIVDGKISLLKLVGTNDNGINKAIKGDIITNGHHMGILIGDGKTISASQKSIRQSDIYGAYGGQGNTIYIFRYDKGIPIFTYSIKTKKNGIQPEVVSSTWNSAGINGDPIIGIAIKVDRCQVNYRVHVKGGNWLPMIRNKYNWNDINGYAGNNKEIDLVEVNFIHCGYNPKIDMWNVPYRVSPLNKGYYDWQYGNQKGKGLDGYAGAIVKSIDHFQIGYD